MSHLSCLTLNLCHPHFVSLSHWLGEVPVKPQCEGGGEIGEQYGSTGATGQQHFIKGDRRATFPFLSSSSHSPTSFFIFIFNFIFFVFSLLLSYPLLLLLSLCLTSINKILSDVYSNLIVGCS